MLRKNYVYCKKVEIIDEICGYKSSWKYTTSIILLKEEIGTR